jgi:hypothetical protein
VKLALRLVFRAFLHGFFLLAIEDAGSRFNSHGLPQR